MLALDSPLPRLGALLAAVLLAACTMPEEAARHRAHHPDHPDQAAGRPMGGPSPGQMQPQGMDMNQMCSMYRNMQNAPMEQRQSMMDQQMKGMSPEMREHHMEMMRQQCNR
jgi:hypothetical protein